MGSWLLCGFFSTRSEWGLLSSVVCGDFSCCGAQALRCVGFSNCAAGAHCSAARSALICSSIPVRDWTHVSCIGRWVLYHWASREAPLPPIDSYRISHSSLIFFSAIWRSCLLLIVVQVQIQMVFESLTFISGDCSTLLNTYCIECSCLLSFVV